MLGHARAACVPSFSDDSSHARHPGKLNSELADAKAQHFNAALLQAGQKSGIWRIGCRTGTILSHSAQLISAGTVQNRLFSVDQISQVRTRGPEIWAKQTVPFMTLHHSYATQEHYLLLTKISQLADIQLNCN